MEPSESLTSKEAQGRLLLAYREGDAGSFRDFATRPLLNPIEQRDGKNKRKVHPMLVIGLVLLAVAVIATFFFSH
ncbi:MAG: hypothetical protein QOE55_7708 [Acidobacteriaceae bacterium]|jgi:hypothetical protein|nr:hypothetical protein [Acidobacteriaceae bacterium]